MLSRAALRQLMSQAAGAGSLDAVYRTALRRVQEGLGVAQGVQLAGEFRPDVILMDIGLPNVSGDDVALEIRLKPWGARMTLVAITGWGKDTDRGRSYEAGFDRHMTKPVDPSVLEAFLESCRELRAAEPAAN